MAVIAPVAHTGPQVENQLQSEDHAGQPHVEARVALSNMAQLMGHQSLKFIAVQAVKGAACDRNHRVILIPAGGKGIDAHHPVQHHDLRDRHAGGNRQLTGYVAKLLLLQPAGRPGLPCAHAPCQLFTTAVQAGSFQPPAAQHKDQGHHRVNGEKIRRVTAEARRDQPPRQSQGGIHGQHTKRDRKRKQQQQLPRAGACLVLLLEKKHWGSFRSAG